jgi:cytochrome c biogenesis protein CcmG/thiol:disulfide interchange protein DsbE
MDAPRTIRRPLQMRGGQLWTIVGTAAVAVAIVAVALLVDRPVDAGLTSVQLSGDVSGAVPVVGGPAPDFTVTTTDGKVVSLASFQGQPVWLTFGASWCADCRAEAPDLEATYARFRDQGLVVLQVSIQEDDQAVRDYAGRVGLTFTMAADPTTAIASRYHILGIPTHFFIGRTGVIREVRIGGLQPDDMARSAAAILE